MSYILDQEKPSLAELAHHGVKGMHWGVRKNYNEIRTAPLAHLTLTTAKGQNVSIDEVKKPVIGAAIASVIPRFRNSLDKSKAVKISVDGKTVGDAQFHEESKDELNLVWLGVNKDQRGKGYASAVFAAGIEYGKQNGYSALTLEVPGNAPDAQHIYEKNGFKVSGPTDGNAQTDPIWGGLTPMSYNIKNPSKLHPHLVHSDQDDLDLEKAIKNTFPDDVLTNPEKYTPNVTHTNFEKPSLAELAHHGVKGMHWGVRRSPVELSRAVGTTAKAHLEVKKDQRTLKKNTSRYGSQRSKGAVAAKQVIADKTANNKAYAKAAERQTKLGESVAYGLLKNYAKYKVTQLVVSTALSTSLPRSSAASSFQRSSNRGKDYVNKNPSMMNAKVNRKGVYTITDL